ncbi:MAG: hypothetical protein GEEBNDBF_01796 [bacterium]|nr:hypothetical protein [bacterium]
MTPWSDTDFRYLSRTSLQPQGASRQLVLLLHGAWGLPDLLLQVREAVGWILPDADQLAPHYLSGFFARPHAERIAQDIRSLLQHATNDRAATGQPYDELLVIGYSLGGCLALRVAELWEGRPPGLTRIVSLAGTNFGWSLWPTPPRMAPFLRFLTRQLMLGMAQAGIAATVRSCQYHRPFARKLRQRWQLRWQDSTQCDQLPWMIQINGADDEFIAPWMVSDFRGHPKGRCWEVPQTQHLTLIQMDDTLLGRERQLALKIALTGDLQQVTYHPEPSLLSGATQPS